MASPTQTKSNRDLANALAKAFDAVAPANRAEAEDELRAAGVDPEAVGQRIEQLASATLNDRAAAIGAASPKRRLLTPARWLWAAAATVVLCVLGWALVHDADATRLLEGYRERMQRTQLAPRQRELAGGPARANHGPSSQSDVNAQQPVPTAAALTPAMGEPVVPAEKEELVGGTDGSLSRGPVGLLGTDIPAGAVISTENLGGFGMTLSAGLQWAVRNGVHLRIVDPQTVYLPRAYREATERYAGRVRIDSSLSGLDGYVAGLPFPAIDANDRQAALKVLWNYEYGPFATDDLSTSHVELDAGALGENGIGMTIEQRVVIEAFRRLYYTGRLFVPPHPMLNEDSEIRFRESMHPVQQPGELRGNGLTATRYQALDEPDRTWLYLPALGRVRAVSKAQRADPLFGTDVDLDSLFGFNAQPVSMQWRLIGVGEALGCMHAENKPVQWETRSGDFAFSDVWEMRPVYLLEGTPRIPNYVYGKRVLYIDQEAWVVLYSDIYDRRGELWKVWLNMFSAPTAPSGNQPIDNPAAVMIDVQRRHVTRMAFPNPSNPQSTGWAFNQGEQGGVTEEWFTTAHLIDSGR